MFNPLKNISSEDKKMLLGGIANGLLFWGDYWAENTLAGYPAELKQQLDPHLPTNGDILTSVGPPAALYAIMKYGKKEGLKDIADGSVYFGIPTFLARTIVNSAYAQGKVTTTPAAASLVRMASANMSKYITNNTTPRVIQPASSLSKYVITG